MLLPLLPQPASTSARTASAGTPMRAKSLLIGSLLQVSGRLRPVPLRPRKYRTRASAAARRADRGQGPGPRAAPPAPARCPVPLRQRPAAADEGHVTISARPTPAAAARRLRALNPRLAVLLASLAALVCLPGARSARRRARHRSVGHQGRAAAAQRSARRRRRNAENFVNNSGNADRRRRERVRDLLGPDRRLPHPPRMADRLDGFMQQMGAASGSLSNVFASLAQYRDRAASAPRTAQSSRAPTRTARNTRRRAAPTLSRSLTGRSPA